MTTPTTTPRALLDSVIRSPAESPKLGAHLLK